jgi:preprotein translocase subunit SecB
LFVPGPYVSQPARDIGSRLERAENGVMTMATNGGEQPQAQENAPQLNVLGQFIKDFSFENPNAPRSLAPSQTQPNINIQINVGVGQLAANDYEVSLKLEGKAESADATALLLFAFDLTYAGLFRIQNVPQEQIHPVVMIECPRLLFPFAREIIASSVRGGGFPPLLLDPVDFVALYQQRLAQMQQEPAAVVT